MGGAKLPVFFFFKGGGGGGEIRFEETQQKKMAAAACGTSKVIWSQSKRNQSAISSARGGLRFQ